MDQSRVDLRAQHATLQKLACGFKFTEGPAVDADGNVYFVDIGSRRIHYWDIAAQTLSTIREDSGGADGLFVTPDGALWICEMYARRLTRLAQDKSYTVMLDAYQGQPFTGPNDLWFDAQGGLYFTDSYSGHADRGNETRVFYYAPSGKLTLLADDYYKSNGIHGSPDEHWLYVADYLDDKIYRYDITEAGNPVDRTLFVEYRCDGMTVDEFGNLYLCTGNSGEGVIIVNPKGQTIDTITLPENPHNICFGGRDFRTLYITATHGLYALKMNVRGLNT